MPRQHVVTSGRDSRAESAHDGALAPSSAAGRPHFRVLAELESADRFSHTQNALIELVETHLLHSPTSDRVTRPLLHGYDDNSDSDQLSIWHTQLTERYITRASVYIHHIRDIQQRIQAKSQSFGGLKVEELDLSSGLA